MNKTVALRITTAFLSACLIISCVLSLSSCACFGGMCGNFEDIFSSILPFNYEEYTVTDEDLMTGSLVLADVDHPYTVDISNLDLVERCQEYRNNQLIADGLEVTKANYPYFAYAGMQLTTPAMEAAHRMLSDAKAAVGQDAVTIDAAYGIIYNIYNADCDEEFKTGNLMFISDYTSEPTNHVPLSKEYRQWLDENAYKYGFIESYRDAYRFVGVAHAKLMKEMKITSLADYIEYLKKNTNADMIISIKVGNEEYSVYYVACKAGDKVKVPSGADYTISGTNEGGIVVTFRSDK